MKLGRRSGIALSLAGKQSATPMLGGAVTVGYSHAKQMRER